jgi:DNA replication protein DnaC
MEHACSVCHSKIRLGELPPEEQKKALALVVPERYVDADISHLPKPIQDVFNGDIDNGVLLWGTPGSGKTYALSSLAKKYFFDGYSVRRVHYELLCLQLRDTFNPKAINTEWQVIEPLLNCDKLFIEDVGTSKRLGVQESDHSVRTLQVLLDMRLERMRPTFITSNKSIENLSESFDERIGDRLKLFHVFAMTRKSWREE